MFKFYYWGPLLFHTKLDGDVLKKINKLCHKNEHLNCKGGLAGHIQGEYLVDPKKLEINADKFENLVGQDAKFNADKMLGIFKGEDNDFSKAVCLNAAAGLIVSEKYENYEEAYNYSRDFIKSGATYKHLVKIQNA